MMEPLVLERVCLENFISHRNTCIELINGVNVIVGPNGAGKTSILEAIYFALTGKGWRSGRSRAALVNEGSSSAEVMLKFKYGGAEYVIKRTINKSGTMLIQSDKTIAVKEEGVDSALRELLNIPLDQMDKVVIIPQGSLTELFIDIKPSERKDVLDKLLGLETYSEVGEKLKEHNMYLKTRYLIQTINPKKDLSKIKEEVARNISTKHRELLENYEKKRGEIARYEDEMKKIMEEISREKLEEKAQRYEELEKRVNELREKIGKIEGEKKSKEEHYRELRERLDEILRNKDELENKLKTSLEKIEVKELDPTRVKELQHRVQVLIVELNNRIGELYKEEGILRNKLEDLEKKMSKARETIERVRRSFSSLEGIGDTPDDKMYEFLKNYRERIVDRENKLENEIRELEKQQTLLVERIKDLSEKIDLLERTVEARCPLCGNTLTDEHRRELISKLSNEKESLEKGTRVIESRLNELRRELATHQELLGRLSEKLVDEVMEAVNTIVIESAKINEYMNELNRLRINLEKLEDERSMYEDLRNDLNEYNQLIEDIGKLSNDISMVEKRLKELENQYVQIKAEYGRMENEYEEAKKAYMKYNEYRSRLNSINERLNDLKKELEEINEEIMEFYRDVEEINKVFRKAYLLKWLIDNFYHREGIPKNLRKRVIRIIEKYMEDFIEKFNLGFTDVEIDEDYNISLRSLENPSKLRELSRLSGGEQVSVAMAALLAIHRFISHQRIGFIALDEPTAHLDEERRRSLVELLKSFQGGGIVPQVIIVTHEEAVREAADKLFHVERTHGYSEVREIVPGE